MFYKQPFEMKSRVHTFLVNKVCTWDIFLLIWGGMSMICKGIHVKPIKMQRKSHIRLFVFEFKCSLTTLASLDLLSLLIFKIAVQIPRRIICFYKKCE